MKSSPPDTHTHTDLAREHTHWSIYIKLKSLGENITCMYPPPNDMHVSSSSYDMHVSSFSCVTG